MYGSSGQGEADTNNTLQKTQGVCLCTVVYIVYCILYVCRHVSERIDVCGY